MGDIEVTRVPLRNIGSYRFITGCNGQSGGEGGLFYFSKSVSPVQVSPSRSKFKVEGKRRRGNAKGVGLVTLLRPRTAALRKPGPCESNPVKAGQASGDASVRPGFQPLVVSRGPEPRALPWAGIRPGLWPSGSSQSK